MNRIVLVNANTVKPPLSPVGLLYLSSYLKSQGIPVEIVDLCLARDAPSALAGVAARRPDLIGVSIRNIDSTQMRLNHYFLPETFRIIETLRRENPGIPMVLGGAGFSIAPFEILEAAGAEYGIVGEGEEALHELVRRLEAGGEVSAIPGLVYRDSEGRLRSNPSRNSGPDFLSELPFQDLDAVDYASYYALGGMASLQTKRGCALKCAYCTYPLVEGKSYRFLEARRVVDEMEFFASRGYDYFHFADSVFNVPKGHALAVCRELARRRLRLRWHAYMSPFAFDSELAGALAEAGNDGVLFGLDSASDRMLEALGKNFRRRDIIRAASACRGAGLEFSYHILFGAPGETLETVSETLETIDETRPTAAFLTQGIRVYRETPVHRRLIKEGVLNGGEPLLEPYYYLSGHLPPDFSRRLHAYALARDFVFSDTTVRSPSTDEKVMALYRRSFRGPCWRVLKELRKASPAEMLPEAN